MVGAGRKMMNSPEVIGGVVFGRWSFLVDTMLKLPSVLVCGLLQFTYSGFLSYFNFTYQDT